MGSIKICMTEDFSEQDLSLLSHLTGHASSFGLVGYRSDPEFLGVCRIYKLALMLDRQQHHFSFGVGVKYDVSTDNVFS